MNAEPYALTGNEQEDLQKLQRWLKETTAAIKVAKVQLRTDPEYQRLQRAYHAVTKTHDKLREVSDKLWTKARERFIWTHRSHTPYYSRRDQFGGGLSTNIKSDVLDAIKAKAGGLSKLRQSDIEEIVYTLINIEAEHNGYRDSMNKCIELQRQASQILKDMGDVERRFTTDLKNRRYWCENKIRELTHRMSDKGRKERKLKALRATMTSDAVTTELYEQLTKDVG